MATAFAPTDSQQRDPHTCGLGYIMARLGQADRSQRWQIAYIDTLIRQLGFPRPFPLQVGDSLVEEPKPKSRWPLAPVDRWLDGRGIPPNGDARAELVAANDMDESALDLGRRLRGVVQP